MPVLAHSRTFVRFGVRQLSRTVAVVEEPPVTVDLAGENDLSAGRQRASADGVVTVAGTTSTAAARTMPRARRAMIRYILER
ncbi:hypothetical protein GCM10010197_06960 [Nocardioides luteus]|uniref:Uncharacterized protein n=1 Tax=Nocardioides luteus TaxID=1844 RepID=A0ABQ5SR80_9ACTN|nr:hypothetical protein GCM10010197_06960 [Nocardioides luteus]GLJ66165.1 hypothetical protein GCM10017579_02010 [Nocardioides luteus]